MSTKDSAAQPKVKPAKKRTRPGRLAVQHQGGPAAHEEAVRRERDRLRIRERQARAYALYFDQDRTLQQVADALGVSLYTASVDVREQRDRLTGPETDRLLLLKERQAERLERIQRGSIRRAEQGHAGAVRNVLDAMAREARLFGLDPERKEGYSLEQMVTMLRGLSALFNDLVEEERLRLAWTVGLRRKAGAAVSGEVIDAEPPKKEEAS